MANAGKKMGGGRDPGPKGADYVGTHDPDKVIEQDDFADEIKGRNSLQGADQNRVRDERHDQARSKRKTEGVIGSIAASRAGSGSKK